MPSQTAIATPYDLPYQVRVQSPPLLSGGGLAILRIIPANAPVAAATADYGSVVTAFALLASTGALASPVDLPAASNRFNWSGPLSDGSALEWRFAGCVFDERAAVVLAQMLLLSHASHPIRMVTLAAPGRTTTPLSFDPRLSDPYPPIWQPIPFPVAIDPDIFDTATLRIQFVRTPTNPEESEIDGQIVTWAVATAMGGYGVAPVPPNECSVQFQPAVTFLGNELEFDVLRLRAHRASFNGLVNACIALHQSLLPIAQLNLE